MEKINETRNHFVDKKKKKKEELMSKKHKNVSTFLNDIQPLSYFIFSSY